LSWDGGAIGSRETRIVDVALERTPVAMIGAAGMRGRTNGGGSELAFDSSACGTKRWSLQKETALEFVGQPDDNLDGHGLAHLVRSLAGDLVAAGCAIEARYDGNEGWRNHCVCRGDSLWIAQYEHAAVLTIRYDYRLDGTKRRTRSGIHRYPA
jgi:hypothetical protein